MDYPEVNNIEVPKKILDKWQTIKQENKRFYSIYDNLEQGICLHEVIYENNRAINYRIIGANSAFEKILGIPVEKARNSLATELYGTAKAPYLQTYAEAADKGKTITFEEYFPPMNKYFHITVTSPERGKFITLFNDITENIQIRQNNEENRKRLSATLKSIGDGVIATDVNGCITLMNKIAEKLTGWKSEDANGKLLKDVFHIINANTRKKVENPVNKVLASGKIVGLANHTLLISRDGTEYQIADSASPIKSNNGEIIGVILVFRDVTEQYKKEQLIRESEKKYRTLVNSSPIGIFKTTIEGNPLALNNSMARLLGCSHEEAAMEKYKDFYKKLFVVPAQQYKFMDILTQNSEVKNFECRASKINGEEIWLSINAKIRKKMNDNSHVINGFAADITEQIINKEKIKEEKSWLESLFMNTPNPIVRVDKNHCVLDINNKFQEIFRYNLSEIKGKDLDLVINMGKNNIADKTATKKFLEGQNVTLEETRYDKEGNPVECLIKGVPVFVNNEFVGGYAEYIDITERKHQEEKIKYMSFHDSLTDLYNRAYLEDKIKHLDVKNQLPISMIMADLNGLKLINDSYGHSTGDDIIIKTAEILKDACREKDIISRWGGDEFVLLLPQTNLKEAQKISRNIETLCDKREGDIPLSIAVGIDVMKRVDENIYDILNKAEEKMYQNKLAESQSAKSSILKALLSTLGEKSHETKEHAWRLQKYAFKIGEKLNLTHSELDRLSLVATLHDIGKIVIPEEILTKPDKLTEEEWDIIKEHPRTGYRITIATEEFAHVAKEILNHHEWWDGTGYPEGKKGKDIPLLSRIIAIVDAYDVMNNGRPYKKPMSDEKIFEELKEYSGIQFDPELVDVFIDIMRDK